jgi:PRTRC genetic system ThiF family protein
MSTPTMIGRFEPRHAVNHVVVVGLGGTGSQLARSAARIIYDMGQRRMHTPRITFIDPDTVEEKNAGRQMFTPADVGQNKAELLMRRFNLALGLDITAIPEPFDPERHPNGPGTLLVGCVDNYQARRALARAECTCWLDMGNHAQSGQAICGTSSDRERVLKALDRMEKQGGVIHDLPNAALVFPELLEPIPEPKSDPAVSCAELVEAGTQHLLINDAIATAAAGYVYRLLHRKPLVSFLSFVNLEAIRQVPVSADEITVYL